MNIKIRKIPGAQPEGWDRSVVFFANILSLFYGNEAETEVLRQEVGVLETYGSRLIPLINILFKGNPPNTLVLERQPDSVLLTYFKEDLGLSLPDIKILTHQEYLNIKHENLDRDDCLGVFLKELSALDCRWIDGYVTDAQLARIADIIGKKTVSAIEGSHNGNNKVLLHEHLEEKGLPVFDTFIAENETEARDYLRRLRHHGYRWAVVKACIGASGIGMKKINLTGNIEEIPSYLFFEGPGLVQGWLDETFDGVYYIGSPSVQMFIQNGRLTLNDITDQILSRESIHEGNIAPPVITVNDGIKEEILSQAQVAGKWLHGQGYRGTASADFHLIERKGKCEVRICEVNARVTGATYPSMLARHFLPDCVWLMRNIRFSPPKDAQRLLGILKVRDLLFEPGKNYGVLPFNLNPNVEGGIIKGQFLFLGQTHNEVNALLKQLSEEEAIRGVYDRD